MQRWLRSSSSPSTPGDTAKVATFNGSCWRTANSLLRTDALVVCVQEAKLSKQADLAEASQWALNNGWHSIFSAAGRGPKGGLSAGVAILARPIVGLRLPSVGPWEVRKGRAIVAMVTLSGCPPIAVACTYLISGVGISKANAAILADVGQVLEQLDAPFVWGGDFNGSPASIAATEIHSRTGAAIIAAPEGAATCRTPFKSSNIDFHRSRSTCKSC